MQGLIHSNVISSYSKHFDSGKYEIIGIVLRWEPYNLHSSIAIRPLLTNYTDTFSYYEDFKPLILEETRAIIESGIEQVKSGKTSPSMVQLITYKPAKDKDNNPSYLTMRGSLAQKENLQANVVLLKHASGTQLLGIASQNIEEDELLLIKVILNEKMLNDGAFIKRASKKWQLYILGSIVTQIRMYEVCTIQPEVVFIKDCVTATPILLPSLPTVALREKLSIAYSTSYILTDPILGTQFSQSAISNDEFCGYTAFGLGRQKAYELLSNNLIIVRGLLQSIIEKCILTEAFINYLTENKLATTGLLTAFNAYQQGRNTDEDIGQMKRYTADLTIVQAYLDYDIRDKMLNAGGSHPIILQALARIQGIALYIWQLGTEQQVVPHKQYPCYQPLRANKRIDLLFFNNNYVKRLEKLDYTPAQQNKPKFDFSQQKAIDDFVHLKQGLQLLQGPPGTGKTTTMVELTKILCQQKERILVCAPSNKAVQVLAQRFLETKPEVPMVLVGIERKVPGELRGIFMHTWKKEMLGKIKMIYKVLQVLNQQGFKVPPQQAQQAMQKAYQDYEAILATSKQRVPKLYRDERQRFILANKDYQDIFNNIAKVPLAQIEASEFISNRATNFIDKTLNVLTDILKRLKQSIEQADNEDLELMLLNSAQVVFATLCISGRDAMKEMDNVDVLIVDEAAQALEAETLIAFQHKPKKCLLVGDTQQLPGLVQSELARKKHLDRSMLWRLMEENNYPYHTLTTQYRMHPAIRNWPSNQYYKDKLEDSENIKNRTLPALPPVLMPYSFIDVVSQERVQQHNYSNAKEATHILHILKYLRDHHQIDIEKRVGIITGYAGQVALIKKKLQGEGMAKVSVHTVDGYQGEECDFILISFVRANSKNSIGFLKDFRRLNVAITRARLSLIMIGNKKTLMTANSDIQLMLQDAQQRQCIFPEQVLLHELKQVLEAVKKTVDKKGKEKIAKESTQTITRSATEKPAVDTTDKIVHVNKQETTSTSVAKSTSMSQPNNGQSIQKDKKAKEKIEMKSTRSTAKLITEKQVVDTINKAVQGIKLVTINTSITKPTSKPQTNTKQSITTDNKATQKKRDIFRSNSDATNNSNTKLQAETVSKSADKNSVTVPKKMLYIPVHKTTQVNVPSQTPSQPDKIQTLGNSKTTKKKRYILKDKAEQQVTTTSEANVPAQREPVKTITQPTQSPSNYQVKLFNPSKKASKASKQKAQTEILQQNNKLSL